MSDFNPPLPPWPPAPTVAPVACAIPMTIGQILDRIFKLVKANWKPFIWIGLFPFGVIVLFEAIVGGVLYLTGVLPLPPAQPNPTALAWIVIPAAVIVFLPVMFLMYGLFYGASTYAALQADHGLPFTAGQAFRHAWSRIGRYTWLMVLKSLIIALPIFAIAIFIGIGIMVFGMTTAASPNSNAATGVLFLLIPLGALFYLGAIVYAVIMSLRLSLAFPACIHEGLPASQSIKRSGVLTSGAKGRIFLVLLIIYAISYAAFLVFYAAVAFAFAIGAMVVGASGGSPGVGSYIAIGVLGLCVLVVLLLWIALMMAGYSIAFAVFYRDQCLRKDGPAPAPALPEPAL